MAEFTGFTLFGIHSDKFKIYSVSDDSRYTMPLFAEMEDKFVTIDGMDGVIYVGTNIRTKKYALRLFVDGITESELRQVQTWLSPKKVGTLIFDETPYKYYNVKIEATPSFTHIPYGISDGSYVYRGELILNLVAYDPFGYSIFTANSTNNLSGNTVGTYAYSGIVDTKYLPNDALTNITTSTKTFKLYNGGNAKAKAIFTVKNSVVGGSTVTVKNNTTNQSFTLTSLPSDFQVTVDSTKGQVTSNLGNASSYHSGSFIEVTPSSYLEIVTSVPITTATNKITKTGYIFSQDIVGKFISLGNNRHYKVLARNSDTQITLDSNIIEATGTYEMAIMDLNEFTITTTGATGFSIAQIDIKYPYTYL